MKRLSIKLRITLWFTLLMTLLTAFVLIYLFSVGDLVVASGSQNALISVVTDSVKDIEYDDGELEIDDDLDYFQDGVYLSIYDQSGTLLYGHLPSHFPRETSLLDHQIQTLQNNKSNWYVYDMLYNVPESHEAVWVRGIMSSAGSGNAFDAMLKLAIVALPILVLLAAAGGYFLINRAFRPVRQITKTAEQISNDRDLSRRISIGDGKDEIYTLAAAFDHMFDRLQESFEREKQFTSDASHELRTPTAVIISQCEFALENAQTLEESKSALTTVLEQARRMSSLISQLLTLARADQAQTKLHIELINLSELCEMVADQVEEKANEKNISVVADIEPNLLLRGDETMLMRMLLNLMENGVKYGKTGGHLWIKLHRTKETILGEILDDGIGIASQDLEKVWERFYQVDTARSTSEEGMGLGLPMVKYIVEAHGGSIFVQSTLGQGSKFTFSLPA
ncbi:Sensor kinase CusS [Eubacteriaceae bacterium CHKCI005]|nr:Sensor kinase CusS [Eubacteriaceae bacterium CHKCI005]